MKRIVGVLMALLVAGCAGSGGGDGWVTLIDGSSGMENFSAVGDVNWRAEGGAIVGDKGKGGFLVSKKSYKDFQLRAEFWADHNTNSGIFIRITNTQKITGVDAYECNIFDERPGPEYGTGGVPNYAKLTKPMVKAGGRWNTYEITAQGDHFVLVLNGVQTASFSNSKNAQGPIGLQFGNIPPKDLPGGAIRWRKVQIKEL
jgi:hypothetical protein